MLQPKTIRVLKPNVTREQAMRHFTSGTLNLAAHLLRGPVRSIGELYVPYRLFRVGIASAGHEQPRILALDAVHGTLDLFEFPTAFRGYLCALLGVFSRGGGNGSYLRSRRGAQETRRRETAPHD